MKSSSIINACFLVCLFMSNCSANGPTKIVIITEYGDIELQLFEKTPQHHDNFVKLVKEGFYDGTLFHRVIKGFMIQGGDPNSRNAEPNARLGVGGPDYTVPAEFVPEYIHKRGALAAARQGDHVNPLKASSGSQFYIVQGKVFNDEELNNVELQIAQGMARQMYSQYLAEEEEAMRKAGQTVDPNVAHERAAGRATTFLLENPFKMSDEDRQTYKTIGGAPHLDGEYTVFGEVIKGMEIIDRIAELETDDSSRPKTDVRIRRMRVR